LIFKYGYIAIYAITVSVGLFHFKKYNDNSLLKWWLAFLIYSFLTECITLYIVEIYKVRTIILTNTWFILNTIFYLIFYFKKVTSLGKKKIIKGLIAFFILYNLLMLFFMNYTREYFVYSWINGQILVVLATMIYYADVLKSNEILDFQKSIFFWISIGVLIFNIGLLPVFVIGELIDWQGIFRYIIFILNIILSLCFITGFIVSKKEFNS
jgi:hypothetical protein